MTLPTERFLSDLQRELHAAVGRLVGAYREAVAIADEHRRGHPRSSLGGGGAPKGGHSDPTLAAVLDETNPAARAEQLMADIRGWADHGQRLVARWERLEHDTETVTKDQARAETGRRNDVETCEKCGTPNPKMKRIDGLPYCATSCYYVVWRARRAG